MKTKLVCILLSVLPMIGIGQNKDTLAPTLISSTGASSTVGGVNLSYSVGEAVVGTLQNPAKPAAANVYLTQGFHQPITMNALSFALTVNNESCLNSKDGNAYLLINGGTPPYNISWSSNASYHGRAMDSLIPGAYTVTVQDANNLTYSANFIITASTAACSVKFYNGITPNGDGHDDTWIIENIGAYPSNSVQIYNRWGTEVWSAESYDNANVVWKGTDWKGQPLPDGTYYYIVTIQGATPLKGWVQLTR